MANTVTRPRAPLARHCADIPSPTLWAQEALHPTSSAAWRRAGGCCCQGTMWPKEGDPRLQAQNGGRAHPCKPHPRPHPGPMVGRGPCAPHQSEEEERFLFCIPRGWEASGLHSLLGKIYTALSLSAHNARCPEDKTPVFPQLQTLRRRPSCRRRPPGT